jgi:hypothetical protein
MGQGMASGVLAFKFEACDYDRRAPMTIKTNLKAGYIGETEKNHF